MVWPGKGEACRKVGVTANLVQILRASTSAMRRSGRKKRALRSNQETDEGKLRRPGELLDKENPIQGGYSFVGAVVRLEDSQVSREASEAGLP